MKRLILTLLIALAANNLSAAINYISQTRSVSVPGSTIAAPDFLPFNQSISTAAGSATQISSFDQSEIRFAGSATSNGSAEFQSRFEVIFTVSDPLDITADVTINRSAGIPLGISTFVLHEYRGGSTFPVIIFGNVSGQYAAHLDPRWTYTAIVSAITADGIQSANSYNVLLSVPEPGGAVTMLVALAVGCVVFARRAADLKLTIFFIRTECNEHRNVE